MSGKRYKSYFEPKEKFKLPYSTKHKQMTKQKQNANVCSLLQELHANPLNIGLDQHVDHDTPAPEDVSENVEQDMMSESGSSYSSLSSIGNIDELNEITNSISSENNASDSLSDSTNNSDSVSDFEKSFPVDENLPGINLENFPFESFVLPGSKITTAEALLLILSFVKCHNLSDVAINDLLILINKVFGELCTIPKNKYHFFKLFSSIAMVKLHLFCPQCHSTVLTTQSIKMYLNPNDIACPTCNNICKMSMDKGNFFLTVSVKAQVKALLCNSYIQKGIVNRFKRQKVSPNNIEDIYDGEIYKKLCESGKPLNDLNNFSYIVNVDGAPVFRSSSRSIYPILLMLNELEPKIRFTNVILAGLWFGKGSPPMQLFLKSFVEEANSLAEDGVVWKNDGISVNSKLIPTCCCVDAVARAKVQNIKQFNGYYGCGWCLHPGSKVLTSTGKQEIRYRETENYIERNEEDFLSDMREAFIQKKEIRGVKGPSAFINLLYFNMVKGFTPDYMHCILLGVTRMFLNLWFSSTHDDFYIGAPNTLAMIDERLMKIKLPQHITRSPRSVSEIKFFKASEFRSWLLYYSVPCLKGILPDMYLKHFLLLVHAAHLLLQESISPKELNLADTLLYRFVCEVEMLYGPLQMTYNVHCLTHVANSVKLHGPLWSHSAFSFENCNGALLKLVKSAKGVCIQIVKRFILKVSYSFLSAHALENFNVTNYSSHQHIITKKMEKIGNAFVLGDPIYTLPTHVDVALYEENGIESRAFYNRYLRIFYKGVKYHSKLYTRCNKTNDRVVCFLDGTYGEILYFCHFKNNQTIYMVCSPYIISNENVLTYKEACTVNMKECDQSPPNVLALKMVDEICVKCILIEFENKKYLVHMPNFVEID